jgi:methionine-S-sulfoxide reductase
VVRTRAGYAGGTKNTPTYYNLGDHSESVQIDLDPKQIAYEKLLEVFWSCPNSCERSGSRQYQSFIFYHNDEQKKFALASRDRVSKQQNREITTPILPIGEFFVAEDYHQKFHLRQHPELLKELTAIYPDWRDLTDSTAAMKLNAYLAGHGTLKALEKEITGFGLSATGRKRMLEFFKNYSEGVGGGQ